MKFRRKADTTPTTADGSAEDATSGPDAATGPFDVSQVEGDGIDRADTDLVLELLSLRWQPGDDGTGHLLLEFAGDGTLAVHVECLNVELRDVTRPYIAPSGREPQHPDA